LDAAAMEIVGMLSGIASAAIFYLGDGITAA
jgi:hypothetical protein